VMVIPSLRTGSVIPACFSENRTPIKTFGGDNFAENYKNGLSIPAARWGVFQVVRDSSSKF
jgi:hypothetical protein